MLAYVCKIKLNPVSAHHTLHKNSKSNSSSLVYFAYFGQEQAIFEYSISTETYVGS